MPDVEAEVKEEEVSGEIESQEIKGEAAGITIEAEVFQMTIGAAVSQPVIAAEMTGEGTLSNSGSSCEQHVNGETAAPTTDKGNVILGWDGTKYYIVRTEPGTGKLIIIPIAGTSGGASPYSRISTADSNAAIVKDSQGQIYAILAHNTNAAARYLKLYNKATAPTSGDTPVLRLPIPGATSGAGFTICIPVGVSFSSGISIRIVGGSADNDDTAIIAGEVIVNLLYL